MCVLHVHLMALINGPELNRLLYPITMNKQARIMSKRIFESTNNEIRTDTQKSQ